MGGLRFRRALVLGGIRSGKSDYAEGLLASAGAVRYVATARRDAADAEWEARIDAHRARRSGRWNTIEVGDDPTRLPELLTAAHPADVVLVDDLGTWVAATMTEITILDQLAPAVRGCLATLVLVSPEVGLSVIPATASGRAFADDLGSVNRSVAAECDAVALVIAGNAVPVKGGL
jgi:nicotinate-nucleotide--dimethylbenzimidazole phosphoribosyltransferase